MKLFGVKPRSSLFRHTALSIAAGLIVFQLASGAAIFFNIMLPLAHRSADDLAALLVLQNGEILESGRLGQYLWRHS